MIKVAVAGSSGRMGKAVVDVVSAADDMEVICGIDPNALGTEAFPVYANVDEALDALRADVMVDFTRPDVAEGNIRAALTHGVDCVVGTTGLTSETLQGLADQAGEGACLFFAPNFTTGAVLMMQFAKAAAPFFPEAEIIEYHHCRKKDAPSGTAVMTARMISEGREGRESSSPGKETEIAGAEGARGALIEGVPVHAVRSNGFVANQEVIFGGLGQTLTLSHVSWDTQSYMPGVLLGIREAGKRSGLVMGLESIMDL